MDTINLQIPVSKSLKISAQQAAFSLGFSSLQELVRVLLKKISQQTLSISFTEEGVLSPKAEKRYLKMIKDIKTGKNWHKADSVGDFFNQLEK